MVDVPVITVDGPGGSGKSTLCLRLAQRLGWHALNSGALYRLLALAAERAGLLPTQMVPLSALARSMQVRFVPNASGDAWVVFLEEVDVTQAIQEDRCAQLASQMAGIPEVRTALLVKQRDFRQTPGLVAEGRDMGTVIFPDAALKIFLLASPQERAKRRYRQLKQEGVHVTLAELEQSLSERDARDTKRAVAPLVAAEDALVLDTTTLSFDQVVLRVEQEIRIVFPHVSFSTL